MTSNREGWRAWLFAQRSSVRLAFLLRVIAMGFGSVMSLVWTRLLLQILGPGAYGVFLSFTAVTRLGGLGDLGITGALAVRAGQAIGRGEESSLQEFLPAARALLLLVSLVLAAVFLSLSPWLPGWMGFVEVPGAGSLSALFATGAVGIVVFLATGYFTSLNLAHGTVTWPILPALLFSQLGMAAHWSTAYLGLPLWIQHLAITAVGVLSVVVIWWMLKVSHPWLGDLTPLRFNPAIWRDLATTSGWMYLYSLSYAIYASTDRLLINAGFGPALVPAYQQNSKLCELALQLILTAGVVSLPKVTRWIASTDPVDRKRVVLELGRMNMFAMVLGTAAALVYLTVNDAFIRLWLGEDYLVPPLWQFAFALNLAITASNDACLQASGLCGRNGLRNTALLIGGTGLLNLALSFWAMKLGMIAGIAMATVVSQLILAVAVSRLTTQYLSIGFRQWVFRTAFLPICIVSVGYALRIARPPDGLLNVTILLACNVGLVILFAYLSGFKLDLIRYELQNFRAIFRR